MHGASVFSLRKVATFICNYSGFYGKYLIVAFMFYYITLCLYISFGVLPPALLILFIAAFRVANLRSFAFLSCVDLQLPTCVKLQLFFAMPEDFFLNKVVILRRFMYFEEWIIAFSSIFIIHPVLLLVIITICTCSLYWYLTVLPFPTRPFLPSSKTGILFGVANCAGLCPREPVFSRNFLESYYLILQIVYFVLNIPYRIASRSESGANSRRASYFLPFSCSCNSTQVMPFACLDI